MSVHRLYAMQEARGQMQYNPPMYRRHVSGKEQRGREGRTNMSVVYVSEGRSARSELSLCAGMDAYARRSGRFNICRELHLHRVST